MSSKTQTRSAGKNSDAIEVDSLRKEFNSPDGGMIVAVNDIDLSIKEGEFFTLVGPSGCGKTTTLRCIAGLEMPTSGSIEFNGRDVTHAPPEKRELAMMFQNIALYPHMNVKDNIAYPLKVRHVSKDLRYEEAREAAKIMHIEELLEKKPGELSGGQRQRAALARTIVQEPVAFLMDEPLSDLDAKLKVEMRQEIQRVHDQVQKPTIYVTHDQEEAMTMSDRIAVMNDGQIEQIGTPDELYHHPVNEFVATFIGMPSMNFVNGQLESLDDETAHVSMEDKDLNFAVEYVKSDPTNSDVKLGFRPESTRINDPSLEVDLEGPVQLLERIGDRMLATIDGPEDEIKATLSDDHGLSKGDIANISVQRDGLYVFDANDGDLIAKATEA